MILPGKLVDERFAQDLHVARQHQQIDASLAQQRELGGLGCGLGLGGDRNQLKVDAELFGDTRKIRMIADDQRQLTAELAASVAEQ